MENLPNPEPKEKENKDSSLLRLRTGVNLWVLNHQISRQTFSRTGVRDAETSA